MNLDELKPFWETYKERVNEQYHWNEGQLADFIRQKTTRSYPWLLNLCMVFSLAGLTGC